MLVTLRAVRGHAPRDGRRQDGRERRRATWGIDRRRQPRGSRDRAGPGELLADAATAPELLTVALIGQGAATEHGVQCCGGEVTVLLEPLPVVPAVAIFGVGHVGLELARILARHDLELHLSTRGPSSSSADALVGARRRAWPGCTYTTCRCCPEIVLGELPPGTHVLVMTHDHAEDAALCDAALRARTSARIGLIGSSASGPGSGAGSPTTATPPEAIARITTPIGLPELTGKDPATIAVAVAADLLRAFERDRGAAAAEPEVAR